MKLADLEAVNALAGERELLLAQQAGEIEIKIDGWSMQASLVQEVSNGIRLALRHRIEAVNAQLKARGVDVGY